MVKKVKVAEIVSNIYVKVNFFIFHLIPKTHHRRAEQALPFPV